MWAARYWSPRYWASRYWAKAGSDFVHVIAPTVFYAPERPVFHAPRRAVR